MMILTGEVESSVVTSVKVRLPDYRKRITILHSNEEKVIDYEQQLKKFIEEIVQKATDVQTIVKDLQTPKITLNQEQIEFSDESSLSNSTTDLCSTSSSAFNNESRIASLSDSNIEQSTKCQFAVFVLQPSSNQKDYETNDSEDYSRSDFDTSLASSNSTTPSVFEINC